MADEPVATVADFSRPVTAVNVEDAAICSECPWVDTDKGAVERAYEHVRSTGHAVQAEHRERSLWKWVRP